MGVELYVLGSRGSYPAIGDEYRIFGHDTSCYIILDDDYAIVLDCGSGLINAKPIIEKCRVVDVLLSHIHYDHIMGLFDHTGVFNRTDVRFYGNFKEWESKEANNLYHINDIVTFNKKRVENDDTIELAHNYKVHFIASTHPDATQMFDVYKGDKHLVYTADYEHKSIFNISQIVKDADILIFDGMYCDNEYHGYEGWGHSSYRDGCKIAKENNVKQLIITHHAPMHNDEFLLQQEKYAKEIFENTRFARQGDVYKL